MEWSVDLQPYPSLEESFYSIFPSPDHIGQGSGGAEWTFEENKLFEDALAEFEISSPEFFQNVAARVPWKTVDDIKKHYQALVEDVELIESGQFPVPEYEDEEKEDGEENGKGKGIWQQNDEGKGRRGHQRRRGVPWTEEEHQLFLMGLNKYGKGDWRSISRYYVITKTPTQVASHAQKYFRRQNSSTPADRRRPSIHDIQTVNPLPLLPPVPLPVTNTTPTANNNLALTLDGPAAIISNFAPAPAAQIPMQINPNFPAVDHNPNYYLSMPSSSSSSPFPPAPSAYVNLQNVPANSYMFPSYGNNQLQPWV